MRVIVSVGYYSDAVADITAAQLETFMQVMSQLKCCNTFYSNDKEIVLKPDEKVRIEVKCVPAGTPVVNPPPVVPAADAE